MQPFQWCDTEAFLNCLGVTGNLRLCWPVKLLGPELNSVSVNEINRIILLTNMIATCILFVWIHAWVSRTLRNIFPLLIFSKDYELSLIFEPSALSVSEKKNCDFYQISDSGDVITIIWKGLDTGDIDSNPLHENDCIPMMFGVVV